MKFKKVSLLCSSVLLIQLLIGFVILSHLQQPVVDVVTINDIKQEVTRHWEAYLNKERELPFTESITVLDGQDQVLITTDEQMANSLQMALKHNDSIVDIMVDNDIVGKVIVKNTTLTAFQQVVRTVSIVMGISTLFALVICLGYHQYIRRNILLPFENLKNFATKVAAGNLELPLSMDRNNIFGAFTESFDVMREELKKARSLEQEANKSKKELVAKLSHDIKTPVASIKAVSEVLTLQVGNPSQIDKLQTIIYKADQIDTLISDMFQATLEELQELTVECQELPSIHIYQLIKEADYLNKAKIAEIPDCLLAYDAKRLQQVFDNIFSNAYKYANTNMEVFFTLQEAFLQIGIQDYGKGLSIEEVPYVLEKFYQGSNAKDSSGAGLGLYTSQYLVQQMQGYIEATNSEKGFLITIYLPLI